MKNLTIYELIEKAKLLNSKKQLAENIVWKEIFYRYKAIMMYYCTMYSRQLSTFSPKHEIADFYQETCIKIILNIKSFIFKENKTTDEQKRHFLGWVKKIMKNMATDDFRKYRKYPIYENTIDDIEERNRIEYYYMLTNYWHGVAIDEIKSDLEWVIRNCLTEKERIIYEETRFYKKMPDEIAEKLMAAFLIPTRQAFLKCRKRIEAKIKLELEKKYKPELNR